MEREQGKREKIRENERVGIGERERKGKREKGKRERIDRSW